MNIRVLSKFVKTLLGRLSASSLRKMRTSTKVGFARLRAGSAAIVAAIMMTVSMLCATTANAALSNFTFQSAPNNFTIILANGVGDTITVVSSVTDPTCIDTVGGVFNVLAQAPACDQGVTLTFTTNGFNIGDVLFTDIDDMDGTAPRDSFAATVPGTWTSSTGVDIHTFAAPPAFADMTARLTGLGAIGTFLARSTGSDPVDDQAAFALATPSSNFSIVFDDVEGARSARAFFSLSTFPTFIADPIVAVAESYPSVSGGAGGTLATVLTSDTLNGAAATTGNVTLTPGTAPAPASGSITMNPDGTITIAAGTTDGTYNYPYQICETAYLTNCATVTESITVGTNVIAAVNDDYTATPISGFIGGTTPSAYANDTLGGSPVVSTDVTPTVLSTGGIAGLVMNADGTFTIPGGNAAGTYSVTYRICEVADAGNCDTADVLIELSAPAIVAGDDDFTASPVDSVAGGNTPTIYTTDTIGGVAFATTDVNATITNNGGLAGVFIRPNGRLAVPAGTAPATYSVTYEICEVLNSTNCDTAIATVVVSAPPIVAVDDDFSASPVSGLSGGNTATVFTNDTLAGVAFADADVAPSITNDGGLTGVTINADGTLTVPASTPAGPFSVTYEICETANLANCDTAVATVVVNAAPIVATDDDFSASPTNGLTGGATPTVFTNDTLGGAAFAQADVSPTITADGGLTGVTINANGTLSVPADTPAGTYPVTYQICEVLNPTNCDTAVASVTVSAAPIVATDDDFSGSPTNGFSGGNTPTVFTNDTLNGVAFATADVTPTITADGGLTGVTINADGTLSVPADTPVGVYPVTYQICEVLNPTNCDTAIASVTVSAAPIVATDDDFSGSPANGLAGGNTPTVFTNDTLNGVAFAPADVTPTISADGGLTGVTINADGTLSVPAGTPAGVYPVTYQICEVLNPTNCDTAIASITVDAASIVATDDDFSGSPTNGLAGGTTPTVFTNDTLNGASFVAADVAPTITADGGLTGVSINPDGTLAVPAGTPVGVYPVTYQICEVLNPTNCDTAIASATVTAASIVATDDDFSGSPTDSLTGGTTPSVFPNDTLNGVAFADTAVTSSITADGGLTGVTINADGTLVVPAGITSGVYPVTYQICETLNATNCDTAIASVTVSAAPIVATNDDFSGSAINSLSGGDTPTVFTNDTLGGAAFVPADVSPTITADGGLTGVSINPDGTLTVPPGTPVGIYPVTYQICEVLNPTNCDTATVSINVGTAPIVATNDDFSASPIDGSAAGATPTVFTNDTLNGASFAPADVAATIVADGGLAGVSINSDGTLSTPAGVAIGSYPVEYRICEVANPTNCDTAIATVVVGSATIVAIDDDLSGSPIDGTGGGDTPTVFGNDTLNGVAFAPADVTPTITADGGLTGVSINPDGTLTVPAGQSAGVYPVVYQICEVLNPTNCDTATASVTVTAAPIVATNDSVGGVNGAVGATGVINVFTNDTLNGAAVNPSDVTLSVTVPDFSGSTTLNPDGTVDVAPGTAAGTYQITYRICEVLNAANCDTAVASVTVDAPPILAADDDFSATPLSGVNGGTTPTVFSNDRLNGVAIVIGTVTPTITSDGGLTGVTIDPSGVITVPPGSPAGTYPVTYQICENANPTNCDTATASVVVDATPLVVTGEVFGPINGASGDPDVGNVLTNDTLGGTAINITQVTLTVVTPSVDPGVTLDPATGIVTVAPGTPPGSYGIVYEVCETLNPTNCQTATATVDVVPLATVSGRVFTDANGNGSYDPGTDISAGSGYDISVVNSAGNPVNLLDDSNNSIPSVQTDANGQYTFYVPPGTDYSVVFRDPSGNVVGGISNVDLVAGQVLSDQNLPIDPSGVVFDSTTRLPIAGVTMTLTSAIGTPLPAACFVAATQQNQITDITGRYRFDIVPGAAAACPVGETEYRISFASPASHQAGFSTSLPPQPGALDATTCPIDAVPGGACQPEAGNNPPAAGPVTYFTSFLLQSGDPNVINNHIPLDPVAAPSGFTKTAAIGKVKRGQKVPYTISASAVSLATVQVIDRVPAGFIYVPGSARVNGVDATPVINGRNIVFDNITPDAGRNVVVELTLVVLANVATGPATNTAMLMDPAGPTVIATATAEVEVEVEHVFDCGEIIGKVFDDKNSNGYQDRGEPGLPGVRIATVKGLLITTGKKGRFNVACADVPDQDIGSNFIMKVDTRTLPTGYRLTTENPRVVRLTRGKITKLNFGAAISRVVRLDLKNAAFAHGSVDLKPRWSDGIGRLIRILEKERSVLRITYRTSSGGKKLARKRTKRVAAAIRKMWKKYGGGYDLAIEQRVVGAK